MRINVWGSTYALVGKCTSLLENVLNKIVSFVQRSANHWLRTTEICAIVLATFLTALPALASDHQDTTFLATKLTAADLSDLFVFESPSDPSKVVLAMDFDPLITPGEVRPFDPAILYQFKIDKTGDNVEDLVLQFRVNGRGRKQSVSVFGPGRPAKVGTQSRLIGATGIGALNQPFSTKKGMKVFVGERKDPFFFDLEQFFKIIPDRNYLVQPNPGLPLTVTTFRPPGEAQDTLAPFNVHSIVVELPRSLLGNGKIGAWMTTSVQTPRARSGNYVQIERLAVPVLNELFMDFKAHNASNLQTPTADAPNQSSFIRSFVTTIGRPQGIADAVISVAIPDVIQADLSKLTGSYFGTQLSQNFGGRRPKDDVIDVTASVVFGDAVTGITEGALPGLTSDNVGANDANFLPTFPYLGNPL
ncbi:MAG: DUF4331 domain-containing protein [Phormidesmis sp. CAN_BIN44]|nr:DUF4331 domain-containing protein [Phormidesmis sp. CAN_BIN44]